MATGVKPRDEECQITRSDLDAIQDAMKNKKFRELLADYCEEVRDPANQAIYQKEMTQLEKERGYDVTFINPKGGYVIKTSVAGDRKAFINICSNENVGKPSYTVKEEEGRRGMNWMLPYSIIPPRDDFDHKRQRIVIYDVVFHPDTLRMAEVNKRFRELVNKTAFDGLQQTYKIHLDSNNFKFPKSHYKGMTTPAVIRKEDPNYTPPAEDELEDLSPEMIEKLYPQHSYTEESSVMPEHKHNKIGTQGQKRKTSNLDSEFKHVTENGYTIPKYVIKQQKNIDFQEFTFHKDSKQHSAIPSHIIVEVSLPLLTSTSDCILDVKEKSMSLTSDKPAKYKLNISLPYSVNDTCGNAKFDKTKRKLIVTLPVIRKVFSSENNCRNSLKTDSGVESEENSHSDEDNCQNNLVVELSSTHTDNQPAIPLTMESPNEHIKKDCFLESNLGYILPTYTYNILDDTVAFTFHVKNVEPDSVKVKDNGKKIAIKFTTIGSGFVPVYYAAILIFDDCITFSNIVGEAWDNNVILQMDSEGNIPQKFYIGLDDDNMICEYFDVSSVRELPKLESNILTKATEETILPVVEVTNLGTETNIVVSPNQTNDDENDIDSESSTHDKKIVWRESGRYETGAKSILRKSVTRSFSESSFGDVASSMDYISSDCIPEEFSLKKTVRFNDVIARQFYRYNSSIEGQKKKNQRKKSKKRCQDRRKSESEAEDEISNQVKMSKPKLKSALKQRHDSGLVDTSDAEGEFKYMSSPSDSSPDISTSNKNKAFGFEPMSRVDNITNSSQEQKKSLLNIVISNTENVQNVIDKDRNTEDSECSVQVPKENTVFNIVNKTSETKPAIWKSDIEISSKSKFDKFQCNSKMYEPKTCDTITHNTSLYDPDKLNKGQYLEVMFKNDLIFDLDM